MGPIQSATSYAGSAPNKQKQVMTLQEKVKLLYVYHRLRSAVMAAHHLKINESSIRIIIKKEREIHEAVTAIIQLGAKKPCTFCKIHFYLVFKMQLLCGCRIAVRKAYL